MMKEIYLFFLLLFVLFIAGIGGAILNISKTINVGSDANVNNVNTYEEYNNNK